LSLVSEEQPAGPPPEEPDELDGLDGLDGSDEPEWVDGPEERRYPSTIGGLFYLLVLASAATGIAIVWSGDWRLGIRCLAAGLCCAALLRLVLPARDAGMLAVRHRFFDAVLLGGVGAALFFLATTIPNQPG
jgi:Protein of unknown function (DUF3017)